LASKDFETEYLKREIEGKSNVELVVMLYDAGLKFMNRSVSYIEKGNIEKTHYNITKAQNIINELTNMLDMEEGGEISVNLYNLYAFITDRLMNANIKKEPKMITEAIEIFSSLREAWVEIARRAKNGEDLAQPVPMPSLNEAGKITIKDSSLPSKEAETATDSTEQQSDSAKKAPRNLFKNVTNKKDKPYKPFSIKG